MPLKIIKKYFVNNSGSFAHTSVQLWHCPFICEASEYLTGICFAIFGAGAKWMYAKSLVWLPHS